MFGVNNQNIRRFRWLRYLRRLLVNYPGYVVFSLLLGLSLARGPFGF